MRSVVRSARSLAHLRHPIAGPTRQPCRHGSTIPPRSDRYAVPTRSHVDDIRKLLTSSTSVQSTLDDSATAGDLVGYNDDWMNKYHGKSPLIVKPRSTEEVSRVVKYCHDNDIAIVPQSGNTGLVGRSHPCVCASEPV